MHVVAEFSFHVETQFVRAQAPVHSLELCSKA